MFSFAVASVPAREYRRLCWLAVGALLLTLLLNTVPSLVHRYQQIESARPSPALTAPTMQSLLPLGPDHVRTTTLTANPVAEYTVAPIAGLADTFRSINPAQQFTTTFDADGIQIAPASGPAWTLRATEIITASGSIPLAAVSSMIAGARVEYQRDGLTEWYVNGPRGLEQGFTVVAPLAGAEQFAVALAVTGAVPTQAANGAVLLGDLRYGDLTVIDAIGKMLPAHLDLTDGTIRIVVDARGAQWPVTIDPLFSQANLTPQTAPGSTAYAFGQSSAIAAANGTTTIVVGAPSELVGTQDEQGAVYVFTGSGSTYTQRARLIASDGSRQKHFGFSVAITISGGTTTIVVGTFNGSKAYVYTGSGGTYTEQARLISPNPTNNDNFGSSVAVATNGGATIIAVGAMGHAVGTSNGQGSVYLFAGSGASYPQQIELNDPNGLAGEQFGTSVALVSNGGTNTLAVGASSKSFSPNIFFQGAIVVFTGSGATYSAVGLSASDGGSNDYLGSAVAVGVNGGITTVAAGAPVSGKGAAYVFAGSGASYTQTKLTDANGASNDRFGVSVAVGYSYSQTLVVVGASGKNGNSGNAADGVLLFTQTGTSYTQSSLPRANGILGDHYGASVAIVTAPNSDPVVVGGAFGNLGGAPQTGTGTVSSWSAQASVQATFGDRYQVIASPAGTYSGMPFHLVASVVDGNGNAIPPTGVTFTVNANGGTGGLFTAGDPTSTTLHVTTHDGAGGTIAGQTDTINLSPSSTGGSFTVTATADGTGLAATYALTILARAPVPTINAVTHLPTSGAATESVARNAATRQPLGLSPPIIYADSSDTPQVYVSGTGFLPQARGTTVFFQHGTDVPVSLDTGIYGDDSNLSFFVNLQYINAFTADTTAQIYLVNPPSTPGGTDGGTSNAVTLKIAQHRPAPPGSKLVSSGATTIIVPPGSLFVPAPIQVVDANGNPVSSLVTGKANGFVSLKGGELIGESGSTIISEHGAGLVSDNGLGVISNDGGTLITNDGGSLVGNSGGTIASSSAASPASQSPSADTAQTSNAVRRNVINDPTNGTYNASTDAHSVIMAPPVLSNGIPGTYTRTLAVDGIAQPVTYTITNLNPHDGHPTTITSLSSNRAFVGDPAFTLTVTGTGFISGSVISFGGVQLVTTFISATQVSATVPATLQNYKDALRVTVINPDPYGGESLPATFTVGIHVDALPPVKTPGGTSGGPNPLPSSRVTGPSTGNPPPAPLPPSR